ncbi:DUF72 domain-containing protein [Actinotalea sp. BY-33]|uniref:DUF72 domain-containing protein n=1 Tax=Actinotalea soli TaxID=2819234 RepID=A0A939RSM5_9CELL|nr:DUF72 domain-containing protein [Actinotalea soli]MBO1751852.1 DUF72 domain-containing protein [Actinotalea soli]
MAQIRVGISGWRYAPWRGTFYPPGLPQRRELEHAASLLSSIEVNGTFYALQRPTSFEAWREAVPRDFLFSVKGGRYLTHMLRLQNSDQALANFLASGVLALGPALGPLLWQLPPTLTFDAAVLDRFLGSLPRTTAAAAELARGHDDRLEGRSWTAVEEDRPLRHVLEVRHASFADPAALDLLRTHGTGLVVSDSAGRFPALEEVTSDLVYVRLHGSEELYVSGYDDATLARWAEKVRGWADRGLDVLVYFDNDVKVRAPVDAQRLGAMLGLGPAAASA